MTQPPPVKRDIQTTDGQGNLIRDLIDGVKVRAATVIPDQRGTVVEVYNPIWGLHEDPLVYVYRFTVRPGMIKGWAMHRTFDDRYFVSDGHAKIALFDDRSESPTYKKINEVYLTQDNRGVLVIPRGVFHAVQNIGTTDAIFFSMPTEPYNYENPDKYRLPLDTDYIPYNFEKSGW